MATSKSFSSCFGVKGSFLEFVRVAGPFFLSRSSKICQKDFFFYHMSTGFNVIVVQNKMLDYSVRN
jgi:hypothetical protein